MTLFDWLSILGAITGTLSASSLIYSYYKERSKIRISFPYEDINVIFPSSIKQDGYSRSHRTVLFARIENLSSMPISIYSFSLHRDDCMMITDSITKAVGLYPISYLSETTVHGLNIGSEQIVLPITLQPYSLTEGYAFFVHDESKESDQIKAVFKVHSTRGEFVKEVLITTPKMPNLRSLKQE